jgi:hypothetical protein
VYNVVWSIHSHYNIEGKADSIMAKYGKFDPRNKKRTKDKTRFETKVRYEVSSKRRKDLDVSSEEIFRVSHENHRT